MSQRIKDFAEMMLGLLTHLLPPHVEVVPLAEGRGRKTIVLRDGYKPQVIDLRKAGARRHKLTNLDDLIGYARRAADPASAVLFCGPGRFVLVFDDAGDEPGRESVSFEPMKTQQSRDWLRSGSFSHLALKRFIEDHEADIVQGNGLLTAVAQFSAKTEMVYQANLGKAGAKSIGFQIQTGQVAGTVELPTKIAIAIPLFEGWTEPYRFDVRLDWKQDKDEQPVFSLEPVNVQAMIEQAIAGMVDHARAQLGEGWMVVRGEPSIVSNPGM